jgi:hypothetical protein
VKEAASSAPQCDKGDMRDTDDDSPGISHASVCAESCCVLCPWRDEFREADEQTLEAGTCERPDEWTCNEGCV